MNIKFALLGAGRIGRVHAQAISTHPRGTLTAVADTFEIAARGIINDFGGAFRSIDEIASSDDIDAVVICTPTNTHADLIEKFARAGKAIFCEKPIDLNIARVESCLKTIAETKTPLMVGFNRCFDPHFAALKNAIDVGDIGTIEMINITSRDPSPPPADYIKVSGGIFRDMTIHDFDMARFLLNEKITSVVARAACLIDPAIGRLGDFDSTNILLSTASGKQCSISNSRRAAYGYDQRIEVHGSLGMISAENQRPISIEIANAEGYKRPPLHDFFMTRYIAAYANEISAFIDMLAENQPASPNGYDGLMALALADAAYLSVTESRIVQISPS